MQCLKCAVPIHVNLTLNFELGSCSTESQYFLFYFRQAENEFWNLACRNDQVLRGEIAE